MRNPGSHQPHNLSHLRTSWASATEVYWDQSLRNRLIKELAHRKLNTMDAGMQLHPYSQHSAGLCHPSMWPVTTTPAPLPWKTDFTCFSIFWLHFSKWSWWGSGSLRKTYSTWGEAGPFGDQEQQHRMETVTTKKLCFRRKSSWNECHKQVWVTAVFCWETFLAKENLQNRKNKKSKNLSHCRAMSLYSGQGQKIDPMVRNVTFLKLIEKGGKSKKKKKKVL